MKEHNNIFIMFWSNLSRVTSISFGSLCKTSDLTSKYWDTHTEFSVLKMSKHIYWIGLVGKPTNTCTTINVKWYSKFNLYSHFHNEWMPRHIYIIWNLASRRFLIDDSSNNRGPQVQIGLYNAISQKPIDIQIFLVV